jgi:hypothetical protein
MDKEQIFGQVKKRQQLLAGARSQMLDRSKTGESDVSIIDRVEAIMRSNKPQAQKQNALEKILKNLQS